MTTSVTTLREVQDPSDMHRLGMQLGELLRARDLIILTGPLGAGKTTLTRGIGEALGVRGSVTSPTFVIARTHPSLTDGPPLVHVDAYRLGSADELDDIDINFDHSVVIIEWGANMVQPAQSWIEIEIARPMGTTHTEDTDWSESLIEPRRVKISGFGPRWSRGVLAQEPKEEGHSS